MQRGQHITTTFTKNIYGNNTEVIIKNTMDEILKKIKSGKLTRDNDETGADGLWDKAYEITGLDGTINDEEQDAFWEIAEAMNTKMK